MAKLESKIKDKKQAINYTRKTKAISTQMS